jgi:hypothetical protein
VPARLRHETLPVQATSAKSSDVASSRHAAISASTCRFFDSCRANVSLPSGSRTEAVTLTRAAQAVDVSKVERLDQAFQPLWSLFKEFGSFRVMYAIADVLGLCRAKPLRPILPLLPADIPGVKDALERILI